MYSKFMGFYQHGSNMGKVGIYRCTGRGSFYDRNMPFWQLGILGNGITADIKFACDRTLT